MRNFEVAYKNQINKLSCSSHILNYKELTRQVDFTDKDMSDYEFITRSMHPYFIRHILGGSSDYDAYFHNIESPIVVWPHSESVIYNLGYADVAHKKKATRDKSGVFHRLKGWHPAVDSEGKVNLSLSKYNVPTKYIKPLV